MSSDRRLKKHIQTLDPSSALDAIAALRPVSFEWKRSGAADMGLIAQEVNDVFPALVTRDDNDRLALKYISLIAPMIASIQELKRHDEELARENRALRQEFDDYKDSHP
jgi:hypothetical protein